jgi:hypothetical protein
MLCGIWTLDKEYLRVRDRVVLDQVVQSLTDHDAGSISGMIEEYIVSVHGGLV